MRMRAHAADEGAVEVVEGEEEEAVGESINATFNFQRKVEPWDVLPLVPIANHKGRGRSGAVQRCTVLTQVVLPTQGTSQFKATNVTAASWMPMSEVWPSDVVAYVQQKRKEG